MKKFFFSKGAIISLIILYLFFAFVSGFVEYLNGAEIKAVLFLRGGTIILDSLLIGLGFYAFVRKWLNKKFLAREFFKRRLFLLAYIAETLAIFLLFYLPYVARSWYLVVDGKTIGMPLSQKSFIINIILGFIVVIALGAWMKKIIRKLKKGSKENDPEELESSI